MFLLLGIGTALSVIVLNSIWGDGLPSLIGVALFCVLGFAVGWSVHHYLLQAVLPAVQLGAGTR